MLNCSDIRAGMREVLLTVPTLPPIIVWENTPAPPPETGTPWTREQLSFADSDVMVVLGGAQMMVEELGVYLVDLFFPEGYGAEAADELADAVRATFPPGLIVTGPEGQVTRVRRTVRGAGLPGDGWYQVPVSIYWRSIAAT